MTADLINTKHSGWGFVLFLVFNGFWIAYSLEIGATVRHVFRYVSGTALREWRRSLIESRK